jgi:hypothetical protein
MAGGSGARLEGPRGKVLEGKRVRLIDRRMGGSRAGLSRREWTRFESSLHYSMKKLVGN